MIAGRSRFSLDGAEVDPLSDTKAVITKSYSDSNGSGAAWNVRVENLI